MTQPNEANKGKIEDNSDLAESQNGPTASPPGSVILTFQLAGHTYGLPVTDVVQIIEMLTITPLPHLPPAINGIINFHGQAVPVMDLRRRLSLPSLSYGLHTPIILADLKGQTIGLVVDKVEAVIDDVEFGPETDHVKPATQGMDESPLMPHHSVIDRLVVVDGQLTPLLRLNTLFNQDERTQLEQAIPQQELSGVLGE
jgi:purine-binding chemotaxis protein CheW